MKHSHGTASLIFLKSKAALSGLTILLAMAFGLLLLSGLPVQAQTAEQFFTYEENSPDPVAHFEATDPEDASPGWWSLTAAAVDLDGDGATDGAADVEAADIADRGLFKVDQNGALSFRNPRSYEDNSASFTSGSPAPTDKQYRVTVQYSDGLNTEYFEAYVTVTDVEEAGRVGFGLSGTGDASISVPLPETVIWQQFQPGAGLEARVTDPDSATRDNVVPTADVTWKWYRVDQNGNATLISGATERTYSPVVEADVGHRIRVEATYTDGNGPSETVRYTSVNPVQTYRRPVDNEIPSFPSPAITRRVAENSDGTFGGPITATDPDGDLLTYTVRGTDASISFGVPRFAIDNATGRLMMAPGVRLNYEADNEYTVMVRAYDSAANNSGADTDPQVTVETTVTISVINVDEKPTFDAGTVPAGVVMAQTEGRTAIDLNNNTEMESDDVATFVASDPDGRNVTLSLMGADAGAFMLASDTVAGAGVSQVLSFKSKTDFEMPADSNMDNVYEVTVRASDGTMHADRMLLIKVINDPAEMGSVKLSADPVVGVELTASVTHMEGSVGASGEVADLKWQWQTADPAGTPATCTDATVAWPADTDAATAGNIAGATKAAYTPVSANEGDCLRAVATYNYQFATAATTVESAGALVVVSQANQAPKFAEGPRTFRVVKEDVVAADPNDDAIVDAATDNVGTPVTAMDANGDTPVYTLGGAGASLFRIRDDGQLEVKGKLDHETRNSHTLTITANDGSGESNARASITVTIHVADVDEAPVIRDSAGAGTKQYRENGTTPVARLTATDPEGARPITWSLPDAAVADTDVVAEDVADHALFKIDQNGALSFKTPRSYEDDSASGDKNYQVAVQASDGNLNSYHELTVAVTNVEERGKITWTVTPSGGSAIAGLQQFKPGAVLTPTVTDPDGPDTITPTGWQWYRGSSRIGAPEGTAATYEVVEADVGHRIRVVATYTDDGPPGPVDTASFTSPNPVQKATQAANTAPTFSNTAVARRVAENSKGTVGAPVTATDPQNDRLTYSLGGTDAASFSINAATGQITVADGATLDYETATSHTVEVTATDSSGAATATVATVTISVGNVNEMPTWGTDTPNGIIMAQTEGRTAIDLDNDTSADTDVATFVASDPEGSRVSLSLMGTDAADFKLASDTDTGNGVSQVLSFAKKTDFEMPADSNRDNVYVVTVRASDGTLTADRMLIIKVINDATESGSVTLSGDAVVGVELTATLTHSEGSVAPSGEITGLKWQWQTADPAGTPATCTDATVAWPAATDAATAGNIADATKAAYTPVSANEGDCVRAVATYVYQFMPVATGETGPMAMSSGALVLSSQAGSAPNQAPKFEEGTATFRVVAENAKPNAAADDAGTTDIDESTQGNIGTPVMAADANGETLSYSLGGADASLFGIDATSGQLQVKGSLNHEANPTHTVIITADDQSGESNATARITVTIYVTDVDEKPAIMVGMAPSLTISGPIAEDYAENGTGAVATYTAMGNDAVASASWSLSGADMGDFTLNTRSGANVRLMFAAAPDFENPTDANTDNVYMVTLTAMAGGMTATRDVQVTVTDVAENRPPDFGFATAIRMVAENTAADENIGAPVDAADPDNDALTYELGGADAADFAIDSGTGQLKTKSALDYETKSSYTVVVTARDVNGSPDDVTVTINVTNVDEDGAVTLSASSAAVGTAITATLTDPDGSVSGEAWQWQSAATADGTYSDISGATSASYTPVDADNGMHIRAMASYTDGEGAGKSAMSDSVMVGAASSQTLLQRYDADNSGAIEKPEMIQAINDYLFGTGADQITKAQMIEVINLYLFG